MQFGLEEHKIKKIQQVFAQFDEIESAVLYGSRAKGSYKPGSDIDITLRGEKLSLTLLNKVSLLLDDLLLPYTFDLSIYHQIDNQELIEHIVRVGKLLYKRTEV